MHGLEAGGEWTGVVAVVFSYHYCFWEIVVASELTEPFTAEIYQHSEKWATERTGLHLNLPGSLEKCSSPGSTP